MIPVYYDLHIHSALSPCADDDMTPNDITGMALLNGLDLIAVTDHNSFSNVESVMKAAQSLRLKQGKDLIVLPGIEVSTEEEVHVLCFFSDLETARIFESELFPFYSTLINRADIFGNQFLFDEYDRKTGEEKRMLIASASISFDNLFLLVNEYGGAFVPAHVDRDSFSVISNLGFLPPHLSIRSIEVSIAGAKNGFDKHNEEFFPQQKIIFSSDAHQLWNISEKDHYILLPELSAKAAVDYLR